MRPRPLSRSKRRPTCAASQCARLDNRAAVAGIRARQQHRLLLALASLHSSGRRRRRPDRAAVHIDDLAADPASGYERSASARPWRRSGRSVLPRPARGLPARLGLPSAPTLAIPRQRCVLPPARGLRASQPAQHETLAMLERAIPHRHRRCTNSASPAARDRSLRGYRPGTGTAPIDPWTGFGCCSSQE